MSNASKVHNSTQQDLNGEVRFIVQSASEAVEKVRAELGPDAQVISVRQVTGSGFGRFLATPRLEIIARAAAPQIIEQVEETEEEPVHETLSTKVEELPATNEESEEDEILTTGKFLEKAGLSHDLLARLDGSEAWRKIGEMDVREGLPHAVMFLRNHLKKLNRRELPGRVAFVGGPGSGKTTALCKLLARDVFINGRKPRVLRLEVDKPHLDDGLLLYCDVLGIKCARSINELNWEDDEPIYVDIPGYSLKDPEERKRVQEQLDQLQIEGRVLVMNAAYQDSVLSRIVQGGRELGATFQILTHVDEVEDVGNLWKFLFDQDRTLLYFSDGQNIAGDRIDDPFGYLLGRTFPR